MSPDKPSERTTRPDGNTPLRPSQLERGIGANAAEKLRADHPEQSKRVSEVVAKKKTQGGLARG